MKTPKTSAVLIAVFALSAFLITPKASAASPLYPYSPREKASNMAGWENINNTTIPVSKWPVELQYAYDIGNNIAAYADCSQLGSSRVIRVSSAPPASIYFQASATTTTLYRSVSGAYNYTAVFSLDAVGKWYVSALASATASGSMYSESSSSSNKWCMVFQRGLSHQYATWDSATYGARPDLTAMQQPFDDRTSGTTTSVTTVSGGISHEELTALLKKIAAGGIAVGLAAVIIHSFRWRPL